MWMRLNKLTISAVTLAIMALAALVYGAYALLTTVDLVLLWAVVATLLIPFAALLGWGAGRYEAKALVSGIRLGADTVIKSARQVADVRDRKDAGRDGGPDFDLLLPRVEVTHRNLLEGDGETIDL
jgi:hypothetical protein